MRSHRRSSGSFTLTQNACTRRPPGRTRRAPPSARTQTPSPPRSTTAPVSVLKEHLDEGRAIMAAASPPDWSDAAHLGADFDDLRWFALPACSLG